jgi:hypothetical protein
MKPPRTAFRRSCAGSGLSIGYGATPQGPRCLLIERAVRAVVVVVSDVLYEYLLEMLLYDPLPAGLAVTPAK